MRWTRRQFRGPVVYPRSKRRGLGRWIRRHSGWLATILVIVIVLPFLVEPLQLATEGQLLDRVAGLASVMGLLLTAGLAIFNRDRIKWAFQTFRVNTIIIFVLDDSESMAHQQERIVRWLRETVVPRLWDDKTLIGVVLSSDAEVHPWLLRPGLYSKQQVIESMDFLPVGGENLLATVDEVADLLEDFPRLRNKRIIVVADRPPSPKTWEQKFQRVEGPIYVQAYDTSEPGEARTEEEVFDGRRRRVRYAWLCLLLVLAALRCWIGLALGLDQAFQEVYPWPTIQRGEIMSGEGRAAFSLNSRLRASDALREAYRQLLQEALSRSDMAAHHGQLRQLDAYLDDTKTYRVERLSGWFRERAAAESLHVVGESVVAGWLDCCGRAQVKAWFGKQAAAEVAEVAIEYVEEAIEKAINEQGKFEKISQGPETEPIRFSFEQLGELVGRVLDKEEILELLQERGLTPAEAELVVFEVRGRRETAYLPFFDSAGYRPSEAVRLGLQGLARVLDRTVRDADGLLSLDIVGYGYADRRTLRDPILSGDVARAQYVAQDPFYCAPTRKAIPRTSSKTPAIRQPPEVVKAEPRLVPPDTVLWTISPPNVRSIGETIDENCELSVARAFIAVDYLMQTVERAREGAGSRALFSYAYGGYGTTDSLDLDNVQEGSTAEEAVLAKMRRVDLEIYRVWLAGIRTEP